MSNTATIDVAASIKAREAADDIQRPIVGLDRVSKIYNTPPGPLTALNQVSLSIGRGEIFGVIPDRTTLAAGRRCGCLRR